MRFHVRLLVKAFDACFRFYRDAFRLEVQWGAEDEDYASFAAPDGSLLALSLRERMADTVGANLLPEDPVGQDRVALMFTVEDIEAFAEHLRKQGITILKDVTRRPERGLTTLHLRDPDGTLIEVNMELPVSEWSEELVSKSARLQRSKESKQ